MPGKKRTRTGRDRYDQWFPAIAPAYQIPPATPYGSAVFEVLLPPTPSYYAESGKSTVIEVDEIEYDIGAYPSLDTDGEIIMWMFIFTRPNVPDPLSGLGIPAMSDGTTWWLWHKTRQLDIVTAGAEGRGVSREEVELHGRDILTDQRGHGRLWVLNKMWCGYAWLGGEPDVSNMSFGLRVWYRYTSIPLHEYIGLVQQFQQL